MNPFYGMGEHVDDWRSVTITLLLHDSKEEFNPSTKVKLPEFKILLLVGTSETLGVHPTQEIIDKMFVYDRAIRQQELKDLMDGLKAIES